jgi:hypothetical protein
MTANQALYFAFLLLSQQTSRTLGTMPMLNDHRRPIQVALYDKIP